MDNTPSRLHPLIKLAAVSVSLFSLVGIGVLTGVIPTKSANPPEAATTVAAVPAAAPIPTTPPTPAAAPVPQEAAKPTPAPVAKPKRSPPAAPVAQRSEPAPAPAASRNDPAPQEARTAPVAAPVCHDCGTIESVREVVLKGEGSGLGAVAGGVVGGVLGNQVGRGSGRDLATVVGVVGGALAGNEIEKRQKKATHYDIRVRMDDGSVVTVRADSLPAWRSGDRVRLANGALVSAM